MAEVHFRPDVKITFSDAVWHHARRLQCRDKNNQECNCDCHFTHTQESKDEVKCNCRFKGNANCFYDKESS